MLAVRAFPVPARALRLILVVLLYTVQMVRNPESDGVVDGEVCGSGALADAVQTFLHWIHIKLETAEALRLCVSCGDALAKQVKFVSSANLRQSRSCCFNENCRHALRPTALLRAQYLCSAQERVRISDPRTNLVTAGSPMEIQRLTLAIEIVTNCTMPSNSCMPSIVDYQGVSKWEKQARANLPHAAS